jgi:hypothetical protein
MSYVKHSYLSRNETRIVLLDTGLALNCKGVLLLW